MAKIAKLDQLVQLRLTRAQLRVMKRYARSRGMRFRVWMRETLLAEASRAELPSQKLALPALPRT